MSAYSDGDVSEDLEKEPVRVLHDVRLRHAVDGAAALCSRVLEREADDALGCLRAQGLDRDAGLRVRLLRLQPAQSLDQLLRGLAAGLELDAGVEVLRVLADDDDVHGLVARSHAGVRLARPQARVEVQLVAEGDIDRAEAGADRSRDRPFERNAGVADRRERLLGQRRAAVLVHDVRSGFGDFPLEGDVRSPRGRAASPPSARGPCRRPG